MSKLNKNDFLFKTQPLKHQMEALCQSATKQNFAYLMEMGCVDGETEFLSNRGWIKFKDFDVNKWEAPLLVGQVSNPRISDESKTTFSFVTPTHYIKKKSDKMYHFHGVVTGSTKPCLDIMVSPEHNMCARLIHTTKSKATTIFKHIADGVTADEVAEFMDEKYPSAGTFEAQQVNILQSCWHAVDPAGGQWENNEITSLNPWELRLMVAIMADGNFPQKTGNRCMMEFSKPHKIQRFEWLCKKAGVIAVKESYRGGKATRFQLVAPVRKKIYDEAFWALNSYQLSIIFDEVFYWDGSREKTRNRFFTIHKKSADFIQYVCSVHGYRTSIITTTSNNAPYYTVQYRPQEELDTVAYTTLNSCEEIEGPFDTYCFRVPSGQLLLRRNDKIFVTGNSGKTKVVIDNMAFLKKKNVITGAIVMAPKGVYRNWSTQEIPKHLSDEVNPEVIVWRADASAGYKEQLKKQILAYDGSTFPILVFNIESLLSTVGMEVMNTFMKVHKGGLMGVIDESTCIKNHKAKRTKKALEIGAKCRVKRIATGSPITNSPLDLYAQFAFLDKQILGCGSYYAFRNVFADIERITTRQGQSFDKVKSYKNLPLLASRIKDFSYRITKKECLDLPDKIYITRDVELTPEQKKLYKEIKLLSFSMYEDEIMSVQIALTKMLRLHQILCGSYTTDDGEVKKIPNNRVTALEEVLEETSGKVIIWANYLQNIADIQDMLTKKYGPESFVTYTGSTSSDDRVEAIKLFQNANSPVRFFLGNVQTAGRGITLTAANTVIYFSNNYSLEMRQQSEDRAHRVGQTQPVTYVDLVVRDSLDEKIIQALLSKRSIANEILQDELEDWIKL